MDTNDRLAIEDLFGKLADVERRAAPRDPEAEAFIRARIAAQPGAPYYMAQTVIVQEAALRAAEERIEALESAAERRGGRGLFGGIFGQNTPPPSRALARRDYDDRRNDRPAGPWGGGYGGGGFLAGAAQTALGVAGGVLLGSMIAGAFSGGEAQAADADSGHDGGGDQGEFDSGSGDVGGGFDGGGGDF